MSRARYGNGRHLQPWVVVPCPWCGQNVDARRTVPGKPMHVKTHFDNEAFCPPLGAGRRTGTTTITTGRVPRPAVIEGQIPLFDHG